MTIVRLLKTDITFFFRPDEKCSVLILPKCSETARRPPHITPISGLRIEGGGWGDR
jgi:hypothetical protein